jgi:hypothetical protein
MLAREIFAFVSPLCLIALLDFCIVWLLAFASFTPS